MTGDRCRVERTVELLNSSLCVVLLYMKSHVASQGGWWGVSIKWLKKKWLVFFSPPITSIQWNPLCLAESQKKVQQLLTC